MNTSQFNTSAFNSLPSATLQVSATSGVGIGASATAVRVVTTSASRGIRVSATAVAVRTISVSAAAGVGIHATVSAVRIAPIAASSGIALGSTTATVKMVNVAASSGVGISGTVTAPHTRSVSAVSAFQVGSAAPSPEKDLGRFQRGRNVPLFITLPGMPDAPPRVLVIDRDSGEHVTSFLIPITGTRPIFGMPLRLGPDFDLGKYTVEYLAAIGGHPLTLSSALFEVVPGGDSGGEVISMHSYDRPEGRYVVAQLGSGKLVQGRNPRI